MYNENQFLHALSILSCVLPQICAQGIEVELKARILLLKTSVELKLAPSQLIEMAKKALQIALELTDLDAIRELAYNISLLSNQFNDKVKQYKRDQAAMLYLATENLITEWSVSTFGEVSRDLKVLVERELFKIDQVDRKLSELV